MSESSQPHWGSRPEGWPAEKVWPPTQSLDDAFDKLRWAEHHFETLRREVEPFEKRDSHTIRFEVDPDAGQYSFYVEGLEDAPSDDWGLTVGDCLHNARTALDYLMVRLFGIVTLDDPRRIEKVQFPIYDDPGKFKSAPSVAKMREHPGFSGYLARIEELQPFNVGNTSIWGARPPQATDLAPTLVAKPTIHALPKALNRLSLLDNLDKHRIIHTPWVGFRVGQGFLQPSVLKPPASFKPDGGSTYTGPLENGTKIGWMDFETPLPEEWHPSEVDMKAHYPLRVSLYDELTFAAGLLEVLPFCLWGVRAVLTLFEPVFDRFDPPLPVTAIPNLDPVPFP